MNIIKQNNHDKRAKYNVKNSNLQHGKILAISLSQ